MMPGSSGPWSLNLRLKSSCDAAYESEEEEAPVMSPILPAQRFRRCLEPLVYQLKCSKENRARTPVPQAGEPHRWPSITAQQHLGAAQLRRVTL